MNFAQPEIKIYIQSCLLHIIPLIIQMEVFWYRNGQLPPKLEQMFASKLRNFLISVSVAPAASLYGETVHKIVIFEDS